MKNKFLKIVPIIFILIGILSVSTYAVTYTSTDCTVKSGGDISITIRASENVQNYDVSLSGYAGLTYVSCSANENAAVNSATGAISYATLGSGITTLGTYKFKAPEVSKDTTYNVVFNINGISNTARVTVKAKEQTPTQPETPSAPQTPTVAEPKFTSVNETVYATTEVNVRKSWSTNSNVIGSLAKGKSVTRTGKGDNGWSKVTFNGSTGYIYSEYLTTTKPAEEKPKEEEKSSNKSLSKLEVKPEGLTPEFKKDVTDYTIKIANNIEKLEIKAEAEHNKAKVQITGNDKLVEGDNVIKIAVTAEDGTVRTYVITATKEKAATTTKLRLETLTIENINLNPAFSPDVFNYTATVESKEQTELTVNATTNDENATVEILGNKDLKDGENIITILVKSNKTDETATYQITVNKIGEIKQSFIPKITLKEVFYIVAGIISLIVLLKIIRKDTTKDKKDKQDFIDETNEDNTVKNEEEQNKKEYLENFEKEEITNNDNNYNGEEEKESEKRKKGKHF